MASEQGPIGLVRTTAPLERTTHADGAAPRRTAELSAACRLRARFLGVVLRRAVGRVTRLLRLWRRRMAESDELRAMSDRELRDFGMSRYDAEHEAKKAFWKASWERW
jgi:uncharacterized protein YjiS (DUF1127 family)